MPLSIGRDEVPRLVAQNAVVVEVLPRAKYEWAHPAGGTLLGLVQRHVAEQTLKEPDHAHR